MKNPTLSGKLALITASFLWGVSFVAVEQALNLGWTPFMLLGMRGLLAGTALGLIGFHRKFWKNKALVRDSIIGGLLLFAGMLLQTIGQSMSTVSNASFITVLYVVFIPLILWKKHPLNISIALAILFAVIGTGFLTLSVGMSFNPGDLLLVGCAWMFAIHIVFLERLARYHDLISATAIQSMTMAVLGFLFGFINQNPLPSGGYIYVLYAGLVSSGLAFLLQLYGQKHVHPTVSGLLLTLESLFGALGAIIILHEPFTSRTLIGGGLMILAVVILELGPKMWLQFRGEMKTNGSI